MGKVNILGPLAREQAVEIVRNGGTYAEASQQTGFGESYIRQLCAKQGFKQAKTRDKESRARLALSMIDEGKTVKEIMSACGYKSASSVYALCKEHETRIQAKDHRNDLVISLYLRGVDYKQIQQETGLTKETIKKICKGKGENVERTCKRCGTKFTCHCRSHQIYCSHDCQTADLHERHDRLRRTLVKSATADAGITLEEVYKRDKGVCYLCGNACDFGSYIVKRGKKCVCGNYPTIEHVIPLSAGGLHSWENVRLACLSCNARKGVKLVG